MRLRKNRSTERAGINEARAFFEGCDYVFQEVDLGNDYGKDAYVDLTDGQEVTGLCIALQIKSGVSYRRASGYAIPIKGHAGVWRHSTLPVAGIVYDPELKALYWCDITSFLAEHVDNLPDDIPVSRNNALTAETLETEFKPLFRWLARERTVGMAILQLGSSDEDLQATALLDCFAAGRSDSRVFVILRYLVAMLKGEPLRMALTILAHATPHPDIFWRKSNWVPEEIRTVVCTHFQWTPDEIKRLLSDVGWEEWQRGDVGQSLYMLLREDSDIECKIDQVALTAIREGNECAAWTALYLAVYWAGEHGVGKYKQLIDVAPEFRAIELAGEIEYALSEVGWVSLFE
jgi:hypothetical protein